MWTTSSVASSSSRSWSRLDHPFLGVTGPSGSGKSSLVRAGLVPAIATGSLPGSDRWRRVLMRPGNTRCVSSNGHGTTLPDAGIAGSLERSGSSWSWTSSRSCSRRAPTTRNAPRSCRSHGRGRTARRSGVGRGRDPGRLLRAMRGLPSSRGTAEREPPAGRPDGTGRTATGDPAACRARRPHGRTGVGGRPRRRGDGRAGWSAAPVDDVAGAWLRRSGRTLTFASYRESGGVHGAVARLAEDGTTGSPIDSAPSPARSSSARPARARVPRRCAAACRSSSWT